MKLKKDNIYVSIGRVQKTGSIENIGKNVIMKNKYLIKGKRMHQESGRLMPRKRM